MVLILWHLKVLFKIISSYCKYYLFLLLKFKQDILFVLKIFNLFVNNFLMFYFKNTEFLKWKDLELWLSRTILKDTL